MRRLGVGSGGGGDRPLRAQIVVALVVVCILIAVPLYLVRRPNGKAAPAPSASALVDMGKLGVPPAGSAAAPEAVDAGKPPEKIRLSTVQHVRCGASANAGHEGNLCDAVPFFEDALTRAVRDNPDCGPKKIDAEGTLNYVLTIDFQKKSVHLFPGASGKWHGKQARKSTTCVKHALSAPDWSLLQHQHRFYTIAVLATYLPTTPSPAAPDAPHSPTGTPNFE
ncbi:MAG TPA: hypothetical protein VGI10_04010 [Polyangiaceae bacterium]|jgi:hypothetical protein